MVRCAGSGGCNQRTDVSGPATCHKLTVNTNERKLNTSSAICAIVPQDISEGGGEPAHIPLCTIGAQIPVESLFIQQVGVCRDACLL